MNRFWMLMFLVLVGCNRKASSPFESPPDEKPALQVAFPETSPPLGQPVRLEMWFYGDERMVLPPLEDLLDPAIEVLDRNSEELVDDSGWERRVSLDVALFAPTNVALFAKADVTTVSDPAVTFELPFHEFSTTPTLAEDEVIPNLGSTELPDFRGPEALRRRTRNLLIGLGGFFLLVSLISFLVWRQSRRPTPPPPPPLWHRIALVAITDLKTKDIWLKPDVDASAVALGQILRSYIGGRFGIHAPERTTEEFLREVQEQKPWSDEHQTGLEEVFDSLDRIKFAGERPNREVLEGLADSTERFVQATAQPEGPV